MAYTENLLLDFHWDITNNVPFFRNFIYGPLDIKFSDNRI